MLFYFIKRETESKFKLNFWLLQNKSFCRNFKENPLRIKKVRCHFTWYRISFFVTLIAKFHCLCLGLDILVKKLVIWLKHFFERPPPLYEFNLEKTFGKEYFVVIFWPILIYPSKVVQFFVKLCVQQFFFWYSTTLTYQINVPLRLFINGGKFLF